MNLAYTGRILRSESLHLDVECHLGACCGQVGIGYGHRVRTRSEVAGSECLGVSQLSAIVEADLSLLCRSIEQIRYHHLLSIALELDVRSIRVELDVGTLVDVFLIIEIHGAARSHMRNAVGTESLEPSGILRAVTVERIADFSALHLLHSGLCACSIAIGLQIIAVAHGAVIGIA